MRFRILLGSVMLLAGGFGSAMGQIDPDPDGIGVYFDEAATIVSTPASPFSTIHAYLILTHPSAVGGIASWKAFFSTFPLGDLTSVVGCVGGEPRFGVNFWIPMSGCEYMQFFVVTEIPQPLLPVTVLADLEILPMGEPGPIGLFVDEVLYSTVGVEGPHITCMPSSGDPGLPVAMINGTAPVPAQAQSWGGVKALFRD